MTYLICLWLGIWCLVTNVACISNTTLLEQERVLCNPFAKSKDAVIFNATLRIYNFEAVDDVRQTMSIKATFVMSFYDKCYWDIAQEVMAERCKATTDSAVPMDPHYSEIMWRPQVVLMNSATDTILVVDQNLIGYPVNAYPDGLVFMNSGGIWIAKCTFDHRIFPFDTQECAFVFETWISDRFTNMTNADVRFLSATAMTSDTDLWQFEGAQAQLLRDECFSLKGGSDADVECWPKAIFTIRVKRRWIFYIFTTFAPAIALCLLQVATLGMPPDSSDRPFYAATLLLTFVILENQIQVKVPNSGIVVHLLVYFSLNIAISTLLVIYVTVMSGIADKKVSNSRHGQHQKSTITPKTNTVVMDREETLTKSNLVQSFKRLLRRFSIYRLCDLCALIVIVLFYISLNTYYIIRVNNPN